MVRLRVIPATWVLLAAISEASEVRSSSMTCGSGVGLCGVLTLESGLGSGTYSHPEPVVHGLWPECNSYGTSECLAPSSSSADPTIVYSCYNQEGESTSSCLSFEQHEWTTHGVCAGVSDAKDFFTQVCSISTKPLSIMASSRSSGGDLSSMANALTQAGYEVFSVDASNSQVELSACAGPNRQWVLAPVAKFSSYCGGWTNSDIQNATSADISDVDGVHNNSTA